MFYNLEIVEPSYEVCEKFDLIYSHNKTSIKPFYCNVSCVWSAALNKDTPIYALYCCGTNDLRVLRKIGDNDWERIEVTEIDNIYGLLWRIGVNLNKPWVELKEIKI